MTLRVYYEFQLGVCFLFVQTPVCEIKGIHKGNL